MWLGDERKGVELTEVVEQTRERVEISQRLLKRLGKGGDFSGVVRRGDF